MNTISMKYSIHIVCLTGKLKEEIKTEAKNIDQLLDLLDEKYSGIKDVFMPPENGRILNVRTMIYLKRGSEGPRRIEDPNHRLRDRDVYFLW